VKVESRTGANTGPDGVSVVIPAFNEEGAVAPVVETLLQVLKTSGLTHEVLIVDDGSTDSTAAAAEKAGARVLRHRVNRGYGAAIKSGMRAATYDLICITDADGTYPSEAIPGLVQAIRDGADMAVASRTGANVHIPLIRRPAKWVIRKMAEAVAGMTIPDINSGLRVFHREHARAFLGILPNGFSFTTTITLSLLSNGYEVEYQPIDYGKRVGRSKIRPIRDTLNFATLIMRIALYFAPLKFFLPLSATLLGIAVAWALVSKLVLGTLADVSSVVLVVAALQVAVVGLLAEMINRRLPGRYKDS
jgi:glycosyltransferase involved in cell wall biosynthesis